MLIKLCITVKSHTLRILILIRFHWQNDNKQNYKRDFESQKILPKSLNLPLSNFIKISFTTLGHELGSTSNGGTRDTNNFASLSLSCRLARSWVPRFLQIWVEIWRRETLETSEVWEFTTNIWHIYKVQVEWLFLRKSACVALQIQLSILGAIHLHTPTASNWESQAMHSETI